MELHALFKVRTEPDEGIIRLLEATTLGTNGARYRLLNTRERIREADSPLFLSMERNGKVIGNLTFCRRKGAWYLRYFAFDSTIQGSGKKRTKGSGLLKLNIEQFFQNAFMGVYGQDADIMYAYIDPANVRSRWMADNFSFRQAGRIVTQSFSRVRPKERIAVERCEDWNDFAELVRQKFSSYTFYFEEQVRRGPFYAVRDADGLIQAFAKLHFADWRIERLPGKWGGLLVKMLPAVPFLRKIIRPASHRFVVPEAVFVRDNDPVVLEDFFESILFREKLNLVLWWVDERDPVYMDVKRDVRWGLLNRIMATPFAEIMVRTNPSKEIPIPDQPVYTSGFDFI